MTQILRVLSPIIAYAILLFVMILARRKNKLLEHSLKKKDDQISGMQSEVHRIKQFQNEKTVPLDRFEKVNWDMATAQAERNSLKSENEELTRCLDTRKGQKQAKSVLRELIQSGTELYLKFDKEPYKSDVGVIHRESLLWLEYVALAIRQYDDFLDFIEADFLYGDRRAILLWETGHLQIDYRGENPKSIFGSYIDHLGKLTRDLLGEDSFPRVRIKKFP